MKSGKWKVQRGFTLIEILIVVTIFAVLGIFVTRSVILTVGGSKKTESTVKVRENLDYAAGVIERQLRNADDMNNPDGTSGCPNLYPQVLNYDDQNGNPSSFSCLGISGGTGYVASGSAILTSGGVKVTECSFSCIPGSVGTPDIVTIHLVAQDANATGIQNATVTVDTQISLRNY